MSRLAELEAALAEAREALNRVACLAFDLPTTAAADVIEAAVRWRADHPETMLKQLGAVAWHGNTRTLIEAVDALLAERGRA